MRAAFSRGSTSTQHQTGQPCSPKRRQPGNGRQFEARVGTARTAWIVARLWMLLASARERQMRLARVLDAPHHMMHRMGMRHQPGGNVGVRHRTARIVRHCRSKPWRREIARTCQAKADIAKLSKKTQSACRKMVLSSRTSAKETKCSGIEGERWASPPSTIRCCWKRSSF